MRIQIYNKFIYCTMKSSKSMTHLSSTHYLLQQKTIKFKQAYEDTQKILSAKSSLTLLTQSKLGSQKRSQFNQRLNKRSRSEASQLKKKFQKDIAHLQKSTKQLDKISRMHNDIVEERLKIEEIISEMKKMIALEARKQKNVKWECKKITNEKQGIAEALKKRKKQREKIEEEIIKENMLISVLIAEKSEMEKRVQNQREKVAKVPPQIVKIQKSIKEIKGRMVEQEKIRNYFKGELIMAQKIMQSSCMGIKQQQNERAKLLLSINQTVTHVIG